MGCFWAAAVLLVILGCASSQHSRTDATAPALRGIDFRADVALMRESPPAVTVTMRIVNRRATPVLLTFPSACPGLLRAYDESDRRVPAWEQTPGDDCPEGTWRLSLMPGEEREVALPVAPVGDVLGTDLPDGSYRFTVVITPDGQVLEVEAGDVDLARSRR